MSVLITGAAGGIGTAAAAELRRRGATVVGLDLQDVDIDCDVRDQASVDAAVARAIAQLGGLDVLINNAGLGPPVRDLATTRQGELGYRLARLAPRRLLDRITTARMRKLAQRGRFAATGLAGEYAARLRD